MTTVAPPPPPAPPSGSGAPAPQVIATITKLPPTLPKLPVEALLMGTVKPQTPNGEAVLQTNLGNISFKAPFNLPANAQVAFKVIQNQPVIQMQLTNVNAQAIPPQAGAQKLGQFGVQLPLQGQNAQPLTQSGQQTAALSPSQNLATGFKAIVLSTPQSTTTQNTSAAQGTVQNAGLLGQAGNKAQSPLLQNTGQPNQSPSTNPTNQAGILNASLQSTKGPAQTAQGQGQNNTQQMIQQGNQLNVRLLTVQTQGQSQSFGTPTPNSTSTVIIQGQVQGASAQGQPIVKAPQGTIMLETTAKFPENAQVRLEVLSAQRPQATATNAAMKAIAPHGMPDLNASWPALEDALTSLKVTNPGLADQMMNQLVPKPDMRLAANVMFFLKALGRGVPVKNWTDEPVVKALGKTKPDVLAQLETDFANLSQKATQANSTDWKIAYVPIQSDEKLQQLRVSHRDPDEPDEDGKEDPGVRFVIDLELSKLGPLQLDGLAKDRHKKFDLIFRTKSALPGHMRKDIHDIFEEGMKAIGFDGKITYQVTPNFVKVDGGEMEVSKLNFGMIV